MTEMIYGLPTRWADEPIIPRWWKNVDRLSLVAVFCLYFIGLLLCMAASPPLAESNQKPHFYYVYRQAIFGAVFDSYDNPFHNAFDYNTAHSHFTFSGKFFIHSSPSFLEQIMVRGVRWFSFAYVSLQPSEFLKPTFIIFCGWVMKSSFDLNGPPGRFISFLLAFFIAGILALQPDFGQASLIIGSWAIMYFISELPLHYYWLY